MKILVLSVLRLQFGFSKQTPEYEHFDPTLMSELLDPNSVHRRVETGA